MVVAVADLSQEDWREEEKSSSLKYLATDDIVPFRPGRPFHNNPSIDVFELHIFSIEWCRGSKIVKRSVGRFLWMHCYMLLLSIRIKNGTISSKNPREKSWGELK